MHRTDLSSAIVDAPMIMPNEYSSKSNRFNIIHLCKQMKSGHNVIAKLPSWTFFSYIFTIHSLVTLVTHIVPEIWVVFYNKYSSP